MFNGAMRNEDEGRKQPCQETALCFTGLNITSLFHFIISVLPCEADLLKLETKTLVPEISVKGSERLSKICISS